MQPMPPYENPELDGEYFRHVLLRLIDHGVTVVGNAAEPPPGTTPKADPGMTYDRVTRAIRRNILLADAFARRAAEPANRLTIARKRLIRDVENAIERAGLPDETVEQLHRELGERLETVETCEDLLTRPVADVLVDFRRDLGLDNVSCYAPWPRRTPADVQYIADRAAQPPSQPRLDHPERDVYPARGAEPPHPAGSNPSLGDYVFKHFQED